MELAEDATRTLHLRTFRETHRDLLTGPGAAPEMLPSWLDPAWLANRQSLRSAS